MRLLIALCLLLFPATARAEWLRASGAHFVVYANDSERDVRNLAEKLERFDAVLASRMVVPRKPPSPSNRITVYVLNSVEEVRKLVGGDAKNVAGFHIARAGDSIAVIPREVSQVRVTRDPLGNPVVNESADLALPVLLHEYAHYFIRSITPFPEPRWMSEGTAEFYSTARFFADGSVRIGEPARHRLEELFSVKDVSAQDLLDPAEYEKRRRGNSGYDSYYGMSWLFYHNLAFNQARAGQIRRYGDLLVQGKSSAEAGLEAFGDFKTLDRELSKYLFSTLPTAIIPASALPIGPIEIRKLRPGEAAMMSIHIRSERGLTRAQAAKLLPEARAIAARYPGDAAVLTTLAQSEYDAGNDSQAIAAADAALAIDDKQANAYVQKGLALLQIAQKADDKSAAFSAARAPFVALSQIEPDNPLPMIHIYKSYLLQKALPPPDANRALTRAVTLAPFDMSLRMLLAQQQLRIGRRDRARNILLPVAYDPHGGALAQSALQALARIDRDLSMGRRTQAANAEAP